MKKTILTAVGRLFLMAAAFAAPLVVVAGTTSALAQPGGPGGGGRGDGGGRFGGMFGGGGFNQPALSTRQIDKYSQLLGLTDDQKEAAAALVEGYQGQTRAMGEKMRERMEEMRANGQDWRDPEVRESMQKAGEEMRTNRRKLDEALMNDVKSLLTPEQADKWPAFERAVRREQGVRRGLMSGERVNLFDLIDQAKLSEEARQPIAGALEEYDVELDRALTARNAVQEEVMSKMMEMRQAGNMEEMEKMLARGREAAVRVRDINRKYARQIGEMLPEDARTAFNLAFKRASFPDAYRETQAERAIGAAEAFEDLNDSQKESIRTLKETFSRNIASVSDRLAAATEEQEMKATVGTIMQRFGRGGGDEPGAIADTRRERREMAETAIENLKKILSPEQSERLPKAEDRGDRRNPDDNPGPRRQQQRRPMNERT